LKIPPTLLNNIRHFIEGYGKDHGLARIRFR